MSDTPRVAVVGMGGYAWEHHRVLQGLEGEGLVRLACTCDPNPRVRESARAEFRLPERDVASYSEFGAMLAHEADHLDILSIATPIALHQPMHAEGVASGVAVYLEKPPTLDPAGLTQMVALDQRAEHRTLVGFNFILEPARRRLKERLLGGEFGALRSLSLLAVWPRDEAYFRRAPWAGRLLDAAGNLVLDSCLGNATSHFTHNLLFWAGDADLDDWGRPAKVQAQLYRAHDIEGADTFFVRATTDSQIQLSIAVTHTGSAGARQRETVTCERAKIVYDAYGSIRIHWQNGRSEQLAREPYDPLRANYLDYFAYLAGHKTRPHTTLADCEPFVHLNGLSYLSSGRIHPLPIELVVADHATPGRGFCRVRGLEQALQDFAEGGRFPDFGLGEAEVRRTRTPSELPELPSSVRAMARAPAPRA